MNVRASGPVFAANWKAEDMTPQKTSEFLEEFNPAVRKNWKKILDSDTKIIIAPPAASLTTANNSIGSSGNMYLLKLGIQDPWITSGAYTGANTFEVGKDPLVNAEFAIIGHSDNRETVRILDRAIGDVFFKSRGLTPEFYSALNDQAGSLLQNILAQIKLEDSRPKSFRLSLDPIINAQIKKALAVNIIPILCVGETLEERKAGESHFLNIIFRQLDVGLKNLTPEEVEKVYIAYEPVWAIGTGETATPEDAQKVQGKIRDKLTEQVGDQAYRIPILYGGSVNPENAKALLSQLDIDGALIGGASLKQTFIDVILNGIDGFLNKPERER